MAAPFATFAIHDDDGVDDDCNYAEDEALKRYNDDDDTSMKSAFAALGIRSFIVADGSEKKKGDIDKLSIKNVLNEFSRSTDEGILETQTRGVLVKNEANEVVLLLACVLIDAEMVNEISDRLHDEVTANKKNGTYATISAFRKKV